MIKTIDQTALKILANLKHLHQIKNLIKFNFKTHPTLKIRKVSFTNIKIQSQWIKNKSKTYLISR